MSADLITSEHQHNHSVSSTPNLTKNQQEKRGSGSAAADQTASSPCDTAILYLGLDRFVREQNITLDGLGEVVHVE